MVKPGPQGDDQESKIRDDGWQGGAENVTALNIPRRQPFCFCHFHIIFAGIDQEKSAPVVNAEEN